MSNREIAIQWAREQVETAASRGTVVMSDEFFKPFSASVRRALRRELLDTYKILAWQLDADGAILCYADDPHLIIKENETHRAAVWHNEKTEQVITFPILELKS